MSDEAKALVPAEAKAKLEALEAKIVELEAQAEVDAMVKSLYIQDMTNFWSAGVEFEEVKINELDSLTFTLFKGDRKIGEQKATEKTLTDVEANVTTSPFNFDGEEDTEYWTKNMELLSGTPDKVVMEFEIDGEVFVVESKTFVKK